MSEIIHNNLVVSDSVKIGALVEPDNSALLDMASTDKGVRFPRMTTVQRDLITATEGLVIYNTTAGNLQQYNGAAWESISADDIALKENAANKSTTTTLGTSDTLFPTQNAVKTYVDTGLGTKQNSLGFTAEDVANKSTTTTLGTSNTLYPTQNAVKTYTDTQVGTKMANPMTDSGDIIYGGVSGAATRLPKGTNGNVLMLSAGLPAWGAGGTGGGGIDAWLTAYGYVADNIVFYSDNLIYKCLSSHTSGTFTTDLEAGKWILLSNDRQGFLKDKQLSDWSSFDDGAVTRPVNGIDGSPSYVSMTATATTPLSGLTSYLFTKLAGDSAGEGVSVNFSIPNDCQGKSLSIDFDYNVDSGTYTNDYALVYIYDVTNAVVIEPSSFYIKNTTVISKFKATFQTSINSTSYRLILMSCNTNSTAYTLKIDKDINISEQIISNGAYVSDLVAYTPTGYTTTNTTYSGYWRRVGDSMEVMAEMDFSGAPSAGDFYVTLPTGYAFDTAKMVVNSYKCVGVGNLNDATGSVYPLEVHANSTNRFGFLYVNNIVDNDSPIALIASGDSLCFKASVPILGWGSSVAMVGADTDGRVVSCRAYKGTNSTGLSGLVKVSLDNITHDTHGAFSTVNNRYTIPVGGYYQISAAMELYSFSTSVAAIVNIKINNTTSYTLCRFDVITTSDYIMGGNLTLKLNAGDYVEVYTYTNTGTYAVSSGTSACYFSIDKLSSSQGIMAGEAINAKYITTAALTLVNNADTLVVLGTKVYDSHGSVVTNGSSTWGYYAPINGVYSLKAAFQLASALYGTGTLNNVALCIYKNNSKVRVIGSTTATSAATMVIGISGAEDINLLAGDYVDFRIGLDSCGANKNLVTNIYYNHVSIAKVG